MPPDTSTSHEPLAPDRETRPTSADPPAAVASIHDQRALQILSTEHWSLLTARSLAYNEAFTRGGMFLTFVSMSFVALALVSQPMGFDHEFLVLAAIVLAFDVIIGLATYGRIIGANLDDMRAVHGMSRIRHGYTQIAPLLKPYFTTGIHDDAAGIMVSYGNPPSTWPGVALYGLTTSGGMISLIVSLLGGVLAGVLTLALGGAGDIALVIGIIGAFVVFGALLGLTNGTIARAQTKLSVMFPSPDAGAPDEAAPDR